MNVEELRAREQIRQRSGDLDTLRIALIHDGKDPDEMIRADAGAFRRLIVDAVPVVDFLMRAEIERLDVATSEGKAEAVELLMPVIYAIPNWVEQEHYFGRLAELLSVPVATLEASVGRVRGLARPRPTRQAPREAERERSAAVFSSRSRRARRSRPVATMRPSCSGP